MNPVFCRAVFGAAVAGLPLAAWVQTLPTSAEPASTEAARPRLQGELDASAGGDGTDTRLGLAWHPAPRAGLQGRLGLQARVQRREALDAFASSRTQGLGASVRETLATGWGALSVEAGSEQVRIEAGSRTRQLPVHRYALGAAWDLAPGWQLTGRLAHDERAPREDELFAAGRVPAVQASVAGDPALGKERSNRAEVGVAWQGGPNRAGVVLFGSRYGNHLHLAPTGRPQGTGGGATTELAWRQSRARVRGVEASGRVRLREHRGVLDLELRGALLHGTQEATGQPLPGVPPAQLGATLASQRGAWGGRLGFDHSMRQERVPAGQSPVPGQTVWGAALSYRSKAAGADLLWYARIENLGNHKASSAASLLAQDSAGRAAVQGRTLRVGVNASF